jgi:predicted naringenin-chalcone synthase
LSKIVSIATGVPAHKHAQESILEFMCNAYGQDETENRKLKYLYHHAGITHRYSAIADYSLKKSDWKFFPQNDLLQPFPTVENRMEWYNREASKLCINTIKKCIDKKIDAQQITHLITVSCTGMSAPGLDLDIVEEMNLSKNIQRTSINFMGCYAAIHALKMAQAILALDSLANVVVVCVEFCTLHFQKEYTVDNITASLLFADGCAALLIQNNDASLKGIVLKNFYSEISFKGKNDMAWQISSTGFLMTLTGYVSNLVAENFEALISNALANAGLNKSDICNWCIHPGGKKILEAIEKSIGIDKNDLKHSYNVLNDFGNMSSPTIIFVLQKFLEDFENKKTETNLLGAAFGPGLTMETFTAAYE